MTSSATLQPDESEFEPDPASQSSWPFIAVGCLIALLLLFDLLRTWWRTTAWRRSRRNQGD